MNPETRRITKIGARSFVIAAIAAVLAPSVADAHTPTVTPSCDGLHVLAVDYFGSGSNNRITVTVDGVVIDDELFSGEFEALYAWSPTEPHTWSVAIDANINTGYPDLYDAFFEGTQQPCQQPTTTTVPATTSTTSSTSTSVPTTSSTSTIPATTTTVVESTSTSSLPRSSTSSTSSVPDGTTTTTGPAEPTTTTEPPSPTSTTTPGPSTTKPPASSLPPTGQGDWLWPFTLAAGCVVVLGGILVRRSR